jgi:uncharacterized membrane protein
MAPITGIVARLPTVWRRENAPSSNHGLMHFIQITGFSNIALNTIFLACPACTLTVRKSEGSANR